MTKTEERAREIADFLGIPRAYAIERLQKGFDYQHQQVNEDFRRANPQTDEELLEWYRSTEEYIWELSAYHLDVRFNYFGKCYEIADRLTTEEISRVLCLGDGVGDLTLVLASDGLDAVYHDLAGSRTAAFFDYRSDFTIKTDMTSGWLPEFRTGPFDAIVSLDFLEHVTDVPAWCEAIYGSLKPGGIFVAQNAFACGSGPSGAIPMHLERNDKYAHAEPGTNGVALWDHLLFGLGFAQLSSNWYRRQ